MSVELILKVAGIGLLVSILNQVLSKMGRDDHTGMVSLAGILMILVLVLGKLSELISVIQGLFGLN